MEKRNCLKNEKENNNCLKMENVAEEWGEKKWPKNEKCDLRIKKKGQKSEK